MGQAAGSHMLLATIAFLITDAGLPILGIVYNYFIFFSLYTYLSAGKTGFRSFWANAVSPTIIALATCSSAASIPANLEATRKIGVTKDIAETVIPLGVNTHKDGSVMAKEGWRMRLS